MANARALKTRRKAMRREAMATIRELPDADLRNLLYELGREKSQKASVVNEVAARLDAVRNEIERRDTLTSVGLHISDHAVLRYLQRVKGVDMKAVREEIALMARRSGKLDSGDKYARHVDGESGFSLGMNTITNVVTTIFSEAERTVIETDPRVAPPLTTQSGEG